MADAPFRLSDLDPDTRAMAEAAARAEGLTPEAWLSRLVLSSAPAASPPMPAEPPAATPAPVPPPPSVSAAQAAKSEEKPRTAQITVRRAPPPLRPVAPANVRKGDAPSPAKGGAQKSESAKPDQAQPTAPKPEPTTAEVTAAPPAKQDATKPEAAAPVAQKADAPEPETPKADALKADAPKTQPQAAAPPKPQPSTVEPAEDPDVAAALDALTQRVGESEKLMDDMLSPLERAVRSLERQLEALDRGLPADAQPPAGTPAPSQEQKPAPSVKPEGAKPTPIAAPAAPKPSAARAEPPPLELDDSPMVVGPQRDVPWPGSEPQRLDPRLEARRAEPPPEAARKMEEKPEPKAGGETEKRDAVVTPLRLRAEPARDDATRPEMHADALRAARASATHEVLMLDTEVEGEIEPPLPQRGTQRALGAVILGVVFLALAAVGAWLYFWIQQDAEGRDYLRRIANQQPPAEAAKSEPEAQPAAPATDTAVVAMPPAGVTEAEAEKPAPVETKEKTAPVETKEKPEPPVPLAKPKLPSVGQAPQGASQPAQGSAHVALPQQGAKAPPDTKTPEAKAPAASPSTATPSAADPQRSLEQLKTAAQKGDSAAQHDLGVLYAQGNGVAQDYRSAAHWFREAALQGVANAQYNLGVLHERGLGVQKDPLEALLWYLSAAEQNHPAAQYNVGVAYALGKGIPKNPTEAQKWFLKAAEKGLPKAQFNLGVIYEEGEAGPKNLVEAYRWYKVASAGEPDAEKRLAELKPRMTAAEIAKGDELARQTKPKS